MDPNANLEEQRRIVAKILSGRGNDADAYQLAELVQALDEWIGRGGFLPSAWVRMGAQMSRYEVVTARLWRRDDGRTASVYGAVPWTSLTEKVRWQVVDVGFTIYDARRNTYGIGRVPFATREEAQAWVDGEHERLGYKKEGAA